MKGTRTSSEKKKEIIDLLQKGVSISEIKRRTGVCWQTISRIRNECGMQKEKNPADSDFTEQQIAQWNYLHKRYGRK